MQSLARKNEDKLLCRNGCGFFGNPEWQWYCSKCWREKQQPRRSKQHRRVPPSPAKVPPSPKHGSLRPTASSAAAFADERPEQKVKVEKTRSMRSPLERNNLKQIFKRGQSDKHAKDKKSFSSTSHRPDLPPESKAVSNEFANFLNKRLDRQGIVDISRQMKSLSDKVTAEAETSPIDDVSNIVQEFYQLLRKRLETHQYFHALTEEDHDKILAYAEKYTMICCYKSLFCPPSTNDEEKDLELQNRIRSLNWITTKELNCAVNESSQDVRDLLHDCINEILGMDGKMAPQDKLQCLVTCCKSIFEMLKQSNESPASADEFLPCLIYICLKANPPRIQSNINFITRFCNEDKLRMGEAGYFFANLCIALSFIETMTADSIGMNAEEFESYVSGREIPPGSWKSSLLMCEGLQVMSQNLKTLSELKSRHDKILDETTKLQQEIAKFEGEIAEVAGILERTSYEIRGPKKPITVDQDITTPPGDLPSPLIPQASSVGGSNLAKMVTDSGARKPNFDISGSSIGSADSLTLKPNASIEDYLGSSQASADNLSLLDLSGAAFSVGESSVEETSSSPLPQSPLVTSEGASRYRGFSAQSSFIPSINCDNAKVGEEKMTKDASEDKKEQRKGSAAEEAVVNVLSGVFNTFDNLI